MVLVIVYIAFFTLMDMSTFCVVKPAATKASNEWHGFLLIAVDMLHGKEFMYSQMVLLGSIQ